MSLNSEEVIDGKYQIVRLLGEGGMGAVYEGINLRIQRKVAIKVLHGNVAQNQDAVTRFEREAQAAGRIGSKHIVEVLDLGDLPDGDRYMVMEFLDGEDLTRRIRKLGTLAPDELFPLAMQLLEGLSAAHQAGIVHRDLKPDNVYLLPDGERADFVKILDFGISKFNTLGGELSMTQTGVVMGTPYYMSPEQAKGSRDLDARTDLYSAGVIMYEAIAGSVPHKAETFNELILKIVLEAPPALGPAKSEADAAFYDIVAKAMARDREARFQTAREFQEALVAWAERFQITPALGIKPGSGAYRHTKAVGTQSAWDRTALGTMAGDAPQKAAPGPKKGRLPLILGAAGVFLVAGVGLVMKLRADAAVETAAAQAAAEEREREESEQKALLEEQSRQAVAARQAAEEAQKRAESALSAAEKQRADAERLAQEKAEQEAVARAEEEEKKKAAAAVRQARAPTPAPKPAPKPKTTSTTSTGRTIRTTF